MKIYMAVTSREGEEGMDLGVFSIDGVSSVHFWSVLG